MDNEGRIGIGRKRVAAIAFCGILVLSLGTVGVFASNAKSDNAEPADENVMTEEKVITEEGLATDITAMDGEILVQTDEDGTCRVSYDGGETWEEGMPENMEIEYNEDGSKATHIWTEEGLEEGAEEMGDELIAQFDGEVMQYSEDGGKTWTDALPEEYKVSESDDGSITVEVNKE